MAFARGGDHDPQQEISTLNDELLQIFVMFYWFLHQRDGTGAEIFLQRERKKRGYESFTYTVSSSTHLTKFKKEPESCSVPPLPKKRRNAPAFATDCLVAPGLPKTENAPTRGPKTSRRSKRGRAGDTRKTSLPVQPHGRSVVPTSTGSTFKKTRAMIAIEDNPHRVLPETLETFEHLHVLGQDACHPSQSQSRSFPLLKTSSYSQYGETVCPTPEEKLFMPNPSVANGQPLTFAHKLYQDERGRDEAPVTSCSTSFLIQVDDTKPMKIQEPSANVYRCKPPLDTFPPIWAQVILSLEVSMNTYSQVSLVRKCANPLSGSGAIKVVFISSTMLSKVIYLALFRRGKVAISLLVLH